MPLDLALPVLLALVLVAFGAGVGITAVGPGGVFLTVALFALTPFPSATVAGTATATFVFTGLLGTLSYLRSGELADRRRLRLAAGLSGGGVAGALLGVRLNAVVSERLFGLLLGVFLVAVGVLVWRRAGGSSGGDSAEGDRSSSTATDGGRFADGFGPVRATVVGLFVGTAGGLLGVGGPVLAVPILVAGGVPMLAAVAAAQVQSVFVSGFAAGGYFAQGAVSLPLAALVGVPELLGVLVGWRVAHRVPAAKLKRVLAVILVCLGPYVALTS
ncbi:TSUP family transporter [Halobium salinum]|uniref:Probable membrane transporter protein n=1 Tax=Halobium salinum TaxID=1364940 RepID=A0ABD5P6N2_9EURY|nr:sulfite exporter TauE/SafE family protein [Halobium salinum]